MNSKPGVSHLLEYLAFKATKNRTHFRLVREVEAIGANVVASATREQVCHLCVFVIICIWCAHLCVVPPDGLRHRRHQCAPTGGA